MKALMKGVAAAVLLCAAQAMVRAQPAAFEVVEKTIPELQDAMQRGTTPMSHSQDIAGPLARRVTDVAILLDATAGVDGADPVTKLGEGGLARSYRDALKTDALKGARIGVLRNLFGTLPEENEAGSCAAR